MTTPRDRRRNNVELLTSLLKAVNELRNGERVTEDLEKLRDKFLEAKLPAVEQINNLIILEKDIIRSLNQPNDPELEMKSAGALNAIRATVLPLKKAAERAMAKDLLGEDRLFSGGDSKKEGKDPDKSLDQGGPRLGAGKTAGSAGSSGS